MLGQPLAAASSVINGLDEAGLLVGSAADLAVLNDDLQVQHVMKDGAWVDLG